jgi:PAS domain S-box-containing protein
MAVSDVNINKVSGLIDFNKYYKVIFDSLPEGILMIDKDGKLLQINDAWLKIHGITKEEALRYSKSFANYYSVYDKDFRELPYDEWPVSKVLRNQKITDEKYLISLRENKQDVYVSCCGIPLHDEKGNILAGMIIVRDISEQIIKDFNYENDIERGKGLYKQVEYYQQKIKNDKLLFQSIVDTIPVMIVIYDENVQSLSINKAFQNITGWTIKDFMEKSIMELVYPDKEYRKEVYDFMESLEPGFRDIIVRTKDGRDIETSWANVKIPDGRHVGVGIDISERKKLENELIKAKEKAEFENQVQYTFIQNISHEVRTPMNSILGFTELLHKMISGEKETEFLEAISFNGEQLLRLINDIMDFSRLDKNELSLYKNSVCINCLINQIKKQLPGLKKIHNKQKLKTIFINQARIHREIIIFTDSNRLQQILINLISNAIKYTDKGYVEIGYKIREDNDEILFYVKDTGIGISKEDYDKVFKRFNPIHNTGKTRLRGTGLGLVICRYLVELLGGEIWFESEPGKGSVFYFTHPYQNEVFPDEETDDDEDDKKDFSLPDLKGKTLLIAEDDDFSYMMMFQMMAETNAKILHAETGGEAIKMLKGNNVDLLFLDIRLPEMDGYEVIKEIRKSDINIPVIAQTASALHEDRIRIKRAGFDYHATKPISQKDLFSIINRFLQ